MFTVLGNRSIQFFPRAIIILASVNLVKAFIGEVRTCIKEKRALSNVGLTIPEVMLDLLKEKATETSKLIKRVNLRPVAGTARQRIMGTIPEAVWTEM